MINVAFGRMHDVFQFVEKFGCDEVGFSPYDVIRINFHHVFAVQVAPVAHALQFVAHGLDVGRAGAFF